MEKILLFCACAALVAGCSCKPAENQTQPTKDKPVVYMTRDISPESLVRIYEALGRKAMMQQRLSNASIPDTEFIFSSRQKR